VGGRNLAKGLKLKGSIRGLRKLRKKYAGTEQGSKLGGGANEVRAARGPAAVELGPMGESCPGRCDVGILCGVFFGAEKGLPGQGSPGLLLKKSTLIKEDLG